MEIIIPKFNVDISGKVHLLICDKKGRTKQSEHFENAIHDNLKDAVINYMASSSGSSAYHINTGSNWFTASHSEEDGKDGIFIWQSDGNSQVSSYLHTVDVNGYDLKLEESKSTTYGGSTNVIYQAEGTWTGTNGSGSTTSGNFDKMHIGKDFDISGATPSFGTTFATAQSTGDFTAFTLDDNDVCRVTWTISIS